jgi:lysophospholipase L1-like esterase
MHKIVSSAVEYARAFCDNARTASMTTGDERVDPLESLPAARKRLLVLLGLLLILADLLGPNPFVDPDALALEVEFALGLTALFLALGNRIPGQRLSTLRNAAIASLLSMAIAGVSAEAAARWVFRGVSSSADTGGYFYRHAPGSLIQLNEHGFRGRSFTVAKPPGTYRIAAIGDSFTFGNGLSAGQRYTDLIDGWLPGEFEVLNFGVPGNNTPQHLDVLRSRVLPAHPDFVLLQWFVNDIEGDDIAGRPRPWPLVPIPGLHRWLNANSALYTVANMRWAEAQIMLGWLPSYPEYLKGLAADVNGAAARREARLLHEIVGAARRHGAGIAIVLFPDPGQDLGDSYPFGFLHERVLAVCRQEAIPCIDLRTDFAAVKDRRALWVSPFDHHPSAKGNEIAAVRILDRLQGAWRQ